MSNRESLQRARNLNGKDFGISPLNNSIVVENGRNNNLQTESKEFVTAINQLHNLKQDINDENLLTDDKTIVGSINELHQEVIDLSNDVANIITGNNVTVDNSVITNTADTSYTVNIPSGFTKAVVSVSCYFIAESVVTYPEWRVAKNSSTIAAVQSGYIDTVSTTTLCSNGDVIRVYRERGDSSNERIEFVVQYYS